MSNLLTWTPRCGCFGILDYVYHCLWRCRACNKMHEVAP